MARSFLIVGGLVVDGSGDAPRHADIEVRGGKIAAIAAPGTLACELSIDASGMIVTPGFVDIHSHADYTLLRDGRAHSSTLQGVTSIVVGNCGHGIAPLSEISVDLAAMNIFGWERQGEIAPSWRSFGGYMDLLRERGVAPNVFPLVAHGALRLAASGFADRALDRREIGQLRILLGEAMASGAVGLSSGLEYAPGISATTQEIADIAEGMSEFGGLYATHCRNRTDLMDEAAAEAVTIAKAGSARLQMSHFIKRPNTPQVRADRSWDIIEDAKRDGLIVFADVFPFDYGPTPLSVMIPPGLIGGSRAEMAEQLQRPAFKARVLVGGGGMFETAVKNDLVRSMYVSADGADGAMVGRSLGAIAEELGVDAIEAAYRLLHRAGENFSCVTIVENWVVWRDLVTALEDDRFFIMGDGATACLDGSHQAMSLSDWGYAPRFLSQFVRDGGDRIPLAKAVHRMTLGPARQIGLTDRGALAVGMAADIVAFRMDKIGSAVRPDSMRHPPTGIEHVWINGVEVVRGQTPTDALPGVVGLKR